MEEPRKVSGQGDSVRWQAKSGRTFATYDEAARDNGVDDAKLAERRAKIQDARISSFFYAAGSGAGGFLVYSLLSGTMKPKSEWAAIISIVMALGMLGAIFPAISAHRSMRTGTVEGWKERAEAAWWSYGAWLLKIVATIIGFVLAYAFLTKITEGLSKGTIIISFLLLCILIALLGRKNR